MKLGVYLNSQHPASDDPARCLAETLEQVRLISSLGFDSIWAGEHHITPGFHFFPQFALLQRAAPDAGLWIGTNVALLPLHNPVELAEVGAFMDVMSGGRLLPALASELVRTGVAAICAGSPRPRWRRRRLQRQSRLFSPAARIPSNWVW
jgi:hypothetical protein